MTRHYCLLVLLLVTVIFDSINAQNVVGSYIIRIDIFDAIKAGEFSIFDATNNQIQYRVEFRPSFWQGFALVRYPSAQVVAKLDKNFKLFLYKGTISIFDPRSNQWIEGKIRAQWSGTYVTEWNGQRTVLIYYKHLETGEFRDESDNTLLAKYEKKLISPVEKNNFVLKVFSDKLPNAIYFLTIAARYHTVTPPSKYRYDYKKYANN